jgi:hypothetical protein
MACCELYSSAATVFCVCRSLHATVLPKNIEQGHSLHQSACRCLPGKQGSALRSAAKLHASVCIKAAGRPCRMEQWCMQAGLTSTCLAVCACIATCHFGDGFSPRLAVSAMCQVWQDVLRLLIWLCAYVDVSFSALAERPGQFWVPKLLPALGVYRTFFKQMSVESFGIVIRLASACDSRPAGCSVASILTCFATLLAVAAAL